MMLVTTSSRPGNMSLTLKTSLTALEKSLYSLRFLSIISFSISNSLIDLSTVSRFSTIFLFFISSSPSCFLTSFNSSTRFLSSLPISSILLTRSSNSFLFPSRSFLLRSSRLSTIFLLFSISSIISSIFETSISSFIYFFSRESYSSFILTNSFSLSEYLETISSRCFSYFSSNASFSSISVINPLNM